MLCRVICSPTCSKSLRSVSTWVKFKRWQDLKKTEDEIKEDEERERLYTGFGDTYISVDNPNWVKPPKDFEDKTREDYGGFAFDWMTAHVGLKYLDYGPEALKNFQRKKMLLLNQYDQRFLPERHLLLGPHLAAAHFLVHRGATVKFVGYENWIKRDKRGKYELPGKVIPGLYLEAIDASTTSLMFEGFDNMVDLDRLRLLSLAQCEHMNDWVLGRMSQFERTLEFLDLSGCTQISAQGLSALTCLKKLRYLRMDGLGHIKDISYAALMLEDAIPGLEVLGLDYNKSLENLEDEFKLLEHPKVSQDARGNRWLEDDCGDNFYLGGVDNEKVVVDRYDRPLMHSIIRKDPPELPLEVIEQIDSLSQGKLRHFLVGSPSGYSWTEESERKVTHDATVLLSRGAEVHPFLLPQEVKEKPKPLAEGSRNSAKQIEENNDRLKMVDDR